MLFYFHRHVQAGACSKIMKFEARYLKKSSESLRGECCAEEILKKLKRRPQAMDYSILFLVLFLVGFGLVILYSTSSYKASLLYNDTTYWVKKQALLLLWESVACYLLLREIIISGRKMVVCLGDLWRGHRTASSYFCDWSSEPRFSEMDFDWAI